MIPEAAAQGGEKGAARTLGDLDDVVFMFAERRPELVLVPLKVAHVQLVVRRVLHPRRQLGRIVHPGVAVVDEDRFKLAHLDGPPRVLLGRKVDVRESPTGAIVLSRFSRQERNAMSVVRNEHEK